MLFFEGKYVSFKNIKFPRGNFQGVNTLLSLLFTTKFSSARQFKIVLTYFQLFRMKAVKSYNLEKKIDKNPLNAISIVYFLQAWLFPETFSRTTTILLILLSIRVFSSEELRATGQYPMKRSRMGYGSAALEGEA